MWSVHQRMAELWNIQSNQRKLSEEEWEELKICLDANLGKVRKLAELKNLSLVASMTEDTDYLHEVSAEIDKVYMDLI